MCNWTGLKLILLLLPGYILSIFILNKVSNN